MAHLLLSLPGRARPLSASHRKLLGWGALLLTLTIWASFSLSLRTVGRSTLTPCDVALIRFSVPAILLLPFLKSRLAALKAMSAIHMAMIGVGAGLPFFLIAERGGELTSAAHVSALIAGTVPLSFSIVGWLFWRERVGAARARGLFIIAGGVLLLALAAGSGDLRALAGAGLLLCASLLWGVYTHGVRRSGIDPLVCVMVVTYPTFLMLLPLAATGAMNSHLMQASAHEVLGYVLVQGIGVGVISTLAYGTAIRLLGPALPATVGALAPVLVIVLAVPLLGEQPSMLACCGVVAITAGVLLCSVPTLRPLTGVWRRRGIVGAR